MSGATAPYAWPAPKRSASISSYARSKAASSQSKPPHPSAVRTSSGTSTVRYASLYTRAAGSRPRSSSAARTSSRARSRSACPSMKLFTSGRYSYSVGASNEWCSSNENGRSSPWKTENAPRQKRRRVS